MRKVLFGVLGTALVGLAYVGYPFLTVWKIRSAMETGNSAYLEHKIEWDTVRTSLRASLTRIALDQPANADAATSETTQAPGLWQRIKAGISQRAVDSMIASYVTPEGLPQLFSVRKFYRENVSGEAATQAALPWHTRARSFWSRIKRAEFKTAGLFEIELADRNDPNRHYIGLLTLRGLEWKLTELHLKLLDRA